VLIRFLKTQNIEGKTLLELGCGTGALACWASKKGARVTASDINPTAVENAEINAVQNGLKVNTVLSNLFEELPQAFDWIVINPPYYPKKPLNDEERAWYAGENFEYFQRLFHALAQKIDWRNCIMVLSEDCDVEFIRSICQNHSLEMQLVKTSRGIVEHNYIFNIQSNHAK
jgi:release factor glutamine methyltransferase